MRWKSTEELLTWHRGSNDLSSTPVSWQACIIGRELELTHSFSAAGYVRKLDGLDCGWGRSLWHPQFQEGILKSSLPFADVGS